MKTTRGSGAPWRLAALAAAGLAALAMYRLAYLAAAAGGALEAYYGGLLWLDTAVAGRPLCLVLGGNSAVMLASRVVYLAHPAHLLLVSGLAALLDPPLFWELVYEMLLVSGLASAVFAVLPTAPPWMVVPGVERGARALLDGFASADPYASFPSLHVAYAVLAAYGACRLSRRLCRAAPLWPLAMAVAVLASGNHYLADVAGGAALAAGSILAAHGVFSSTQHRQLENDGPGAAS